MATDRALTDATNMVQDTTARGKQQAAAGADHHFVWRHIFSLSLLKSLPCE